MSIRFLLGRLSGLASLVAVLVAAVPAAAVVVLDEDFTAAEGYVDGKLQFQEPNGSGNGIWLGQVNGNTGATPAVDSTGDGFVVANGGPQSNGGTGDAFLRNIWNTGATGALLGGSNPETGAGFSEGDQIKIDLEFVIEIPDGTANHDLFVAGVRDCFATCPVGPPNEAFQATPLAGLNLGLSPFQAGSVKVFTNQSRVFTTGSDNPFALFASLPDIGMSNGWNPATEMKDLPTDLVSDRIALSYTAELTDESTDTWTATELVVTNLDTATEVSRASTDKPAALESFVWNTTGVDNPFTDADESGVALTTGTDMWFAARWMDNSNPDATNRFDSVRYEYIPVPGPPVPGDYNGNGTVDAADYTVWRDSNNTVGAGLPADGTGDDDLGVPDGDVDQFDYQFWANRFGNTSSLAVAVPEPSAIAFALVGMAAGCGKRRGIQ